MKLEFLLALLYTALYGRDIVLRIIIEYSGLRDFGPQTLGEMIHPNLVFNERLTKQILCSCGLVFFQVVEVKSWEGSVCRARSFGGGQSRKLQVVWGLFWLEIVIRPTWKVGARAPWSYYKVFNKNHMENTKCKVGGEVWNANCEMGTSRIVTDKELKRSSSQKHLINFWVWWLLHLWPKCFHFYSSRSCLF